MSVVKNIPDGWAEITLGQVGKVITGKTPSKDNPEDWGNTIDFITPTDIKSDNKYLFECSRKLSISGIKRFEKMILPEKSVIVTCIGSDMGKVILNRNKALANQQINSIIINEKNCADFIYYLLKDSYKILRKKAGGSGSTMPILNKSTFESLSFNIPKYNEQKSIASILTAFDNKIELLQAQNKTLEETAQTIFKEWFGKYQIDDELPEGWSVGIIGDLIGELESGTRPKGGVGNILEGIPSIGAESIGGITNFDYSKTKYVPFDFFNKMNRGKVKEYDILIYKDGGTPGTFIPKFSIFGEGFPFSVFCINEHVFRVQPKKEYQRFYLYNWLNSYFCKKQLQNIGGKAAIPGINSTDFKNLEIIIPIDSLIKSYNNVVKSSYKKILTNMIQIQSLSKTRDELLPRLMSGEVRVKM